MGPVQTSDDSKSQPVVVCLVTIKETNINMKETCLKSSRKISENNSDPEVHQPCSAAWDTLLHSASPKYA